MKDARHLLAGVGAGVGSTALLHPLDLVKVRLHVQEQVESSGARSYAGTVDAFRKIVRNEGYLALYQGVSPNMLGSASAWGSYFFFYERIKRTLRGEGGAQLGAVEHMSAALVAGTGTLLVTNPIWVVKTRMCLQDPKGVSASAAPAYRYTSIRAALADIFRTEGVAGLYRGLLPGLVGVTHGGFQFGLYEDLKARFNGHMGRAPDAELETVAYIVMAGSSKIFAQTITYPVQVIRSRLQHDPSRKALPECRHLYRNFGIGGFYKGLVPGLLRVMPATCTTFVLYERLSRIFGRLLGTEGGLPA